MTRLRIEIAAARLAAGYHDCHDTDDDLADPIVRAMIAYSIGDGDLTPSQQEAWDLYLEIIHGE